MGSTDGWSAREIEKYLDVVNDPRFKLFGFTREEVLRIRRFLDVHKLSIEELEKMDLASTLARGCNQEEGRMAKETYCIGQKVKIGGSRYLLAQVLQGKCCLILIAGGNRYLDPINVKDIFKITRHEMFKMAGSTGWEIVLPKKKRKP